MIMALDTSIRCPRPVIVVLLSSWLPSFCLFLVAVAFLVWQQDGEIKHFRVSQPRNHQRPFTPLNNNHNNNNNCLFSLSSSLSLLLSLFFSLFSLSSLPLLSLFSLSSSLFSLSSLSLLSLFSLFFSLFFLPSHTRTLCGWGLNGRATSATVDRRR